MPDESRFCSACGAALETPKGAERKLATVVFADLVGSTKLVEGRDPEDVRDSSQPFIEIARRTFEEHGGRVEKYIGDAVMAVFGAPVAHGDDPDRAVAAAWRSSTGSSPRRAARAPDRDRGGRGCWSAPATATSSVTGEPTHAAARLQQAATAGEVLVGPRAAGACALGRARRPEGDRGGGIPGTARGLAGDVPAAGTVRGPMRGH